MTASARPQATVTPTTSGRPTMTGPKPNAGIERAYSSPKPLAPCDLWLAGNEGRAPRRFDVRARGETLGRYPSTDALAARFGERLGVGPERVVVTAGADDALLRIALAYLAPGRRMVMPSPTFEMIPRYARIAGGEVAEVPWELDAPYPTDAVLDAITDDTSVVTIVSPNNPSGAVATAEDVERVCDAAPNALVVVDQAYAEFCDEDLAAVTLSRPNAVLLRTMSKAYGCPGLRVGYAIGAPDVIDVLRAAGNPYPVATPSIAAATERLDASIEPFVNAVRAEREGLRELLGGLGIEVVPSEGNFVLARTPRAGRLRELLAGLGVAVRTFPTSPGLEDTVRITCPGDATDFERLTSGLRAALAPEAILFDMDGVLADVSRSFRVAIVETARSFGVEVTDADVDAMKAQGGANDDWELTQRLIARGGVTANLDEVTARFEDLYQGTDGAPGLRETETLLIDRDALERLGRRARLGVVTGRPRSDARRFLERHGIVELFDIVVTRDDAPLKPDPAPVELALSALRVTSAWMLGDTRDDVVSARRAGVVPIGVVPPGGSNERREALRTHLLTSGAGVCLDRTTELEEILA
ncbi:MAG: TIGR01548 family HAD-type hydrolase [Planctomycetota bacterium]